jgi:hypothetical protein
MSEDEGRAAALPGGGRTEPRWWPRRRPVMVTAMATLVCVGAACERVVTPVGTPVATEAPAPAVAEAVLSPSTSTPGTTGSGAPPAVSGVEVVRREGDDVEFAYVDVSGQRRTFAVQVRRPSGAATEAETPVLVWSHGGADGKDGAGAVERVGDGWSRAFTEAGYVVVAIAHHGRDLDSRYRLCEAIGVAACDTFRYLTWDRPHDARVVFDWLESIVADGEPLDLDRLVYGGHSSGSTSVLTIGGLTGTIPGVRQPGRDLRPRVLIAASPTGRTGLGVDAEGFASVDRPVLVLTGVGDETDGANGVDRAETFELLASPDDRLVWVDDDRAQHTTFDLDLSACRRAGGTRVRCRAIVEALAGAAVGYVDAVLNGTDMATWIEPELATGVSWGLPG